MNALVPLLREHPVPSSGQVAQVFNEYFERHHPRANLIHKFSGYTTRNEAQETWFHKIAAQYIVPLISDKTKASAYIKLYDASPRLEYLPLPELDVQAEGRRGRTRWSTVGTVSAVVGIGALAWWRYHK